jgi:hypothetical protein
MPTTFSPVKKGAESPSQRPPHRAEAPVTCLIQSRAPRNQLPLLASSPAHSQTAPSQRLQSRAYVTELPLGVQPSLFPANSLPAQPSAIVHPPRQSRSRRLLLLQGPGQSCPWTLSPRNTHHYRHQKAHLGCPMWLTPPLFSRSFPMLRSARNHPQSFARMHPQTESLSDALSTRKGCRACHR